MVRAENAGDNVSEYVARVASAVRGRFRHGVQFIRSRRRKVLALGCGQSPKHLFRFGHDAAPLEKEPGRPELTLNAKGISNHTPEFAEAASSQRADELTPAGSLALAWTAADVLLRPDVRERLRESFRRQLGKEPAE